MKKIISTILVGAMLLSMGTTALATTVTDFANSTEIAVTGIFNASTPESVYSVDIAWGSMEFTYKEASEGTWNPDSHEFENPAESVWSHTDGANKITVTNHSNASVDVGLSYTPATGSAVTGDFYPTEEDEVSVSGFVLRTAVGTDHANAPTEEAYLKVGGTLTSAQNNTTIGEITVSLQTSNRG